MIHRVQAMVIGAAAALLVGVMTAVVVWRWAIEDRRRTQEEGDAWTS